MDASPAQTVSARIFDPANSIFKQPKSARAECSTISCTLPQCPLRDVGTCMLAPLIRFTRCPYGQCHTEEGPTRRSGSYRKWVSDHKEQYSGVPHLGSPANKLAFVGDYVYLPYAHMTMCHAVPFPQHSSMFLSGTALLHVDDWTLDTVVKLLDFRPRTYLGNCEIADYQEKSVPAFLVHLRECDPSMWKRLVAARPALNTAPNHCGRKALLRTLKPGIAWTTSGGHKSSYPVTWRWDGNHVRTCSQHAYNSTWGDLPLAELEIAAIPSGNAAVVVLDNCWVTEDTVFMD